MGNRIEMLFAFIFTFLCLLQFDTLFGVQFEKGKCCQNNFFEILGEC